MTPGVFRLAAAFTLVITPGVLFQQPDLSPQALARLWDAEHVSPPISPLVDHAEVKRRIQTLTPDHMRVREIGRSLEDREIWSVTFGTGPNVVLMWSQMHGDEPTATSALFDLYDYIRRHRSEPHVARLLSRLTVHTVPMLNPDGAERFQRRNVQGLDINRDALLLQSPEGQLLKRLRDELNPMVGFNLHNQSWNTTAGRPPRPASISLLSVAFDEGRLLTKRLGAVVRDSLEPLAPGQIGKYDDEFEVRAFGDNITKWGTPVLLIETGPWPDLNPDPALVRLNFVALVRALTSLADGSVHKADPARYDSLPENESRGFFYLIRNVRIRIVENARRLFLSMSVNDLGDLRTFTGLFEIDGTGKVLAPLQPGAAIGSMVDLPQVAGTIATGTAADLMLLEPAGGMYRVARTFSAQQEVR